MRYDVSRRVASLIMRLIIFLCLISLLTRLATVRLRSCHVLGTPTVAVPYRHRSSYDKTRLMSNDYLVIPFLDLVIS